MTKFKYEAISLSGVPITGVVEAHDRGDAVIRLKETCQLVNKLTEAPDNGLRELLNKKKFNEKNLSLVCKQFSIILHAGIPIVKTVELVAGQTEDKLLHKLLLSVSEDVNAGFSLADSFAQRGPQLPATFIETLRAGEESGALDIAFSRLSTFYAKKSRIRGKVVSSLTYPAFVVGVAIIVIIIIMVYAVPMFASTFASMGADLPLPTKLLIGMSNFFSRYILVLLVIVAALIVGLKFYGGTEKGRYALDKFYLRLPLLGRISLMNNASQFANTLSTMLAAGLPVVKALAITGRSLSNARLGRAVLDIVENVESGFRVGRSMRETHVFPDLLTEMTAVGEEAGSMEETLGVIGEYYDNEVETTTTRAVGLLEPIIICVLAVFVVLVLLAVYLPMFGMYGSIG